jgi:hypothetical protein
VTDHPPTFFSRVTASIPGWVLLFAGMGITATGVFAEDWSRNDAILWQRDMIQTQAKQVADQKNNYILFHTALAKEDPILLERLAMTQLRLKPEQLDVPGISKPVLVTQSAQPAAVPVRQKTKEQSRPLPPIVPVEDLLSQPVSHPGVNISEYQAPKSTLLSICSGNSRLGVIAAGILCILAGLISPTGNPREDEALET